MTLQETYITQRNIFIRRDQVIYTDVGKVRIDTVSGGGWRIDIIDGENVCYGIDVLDCCYWLNKHHAQVDV